MRRVVVVALALSAGCKSKRHAAPAPVVEDDAAVAEDDAEEAAAETVAMADAIAAGAIAVMFVQSSAPMQDETHIYMNNWVHSSKLVIVNQDEDTTIALPKFLFARLPGYVYPYEGEGCLPEEQWLIEAPEAEVEIAAGATEELSTPAIWFLGNSMRPPPFAESGPTALQVKAALEGDRFVRLAEEVHDEPPAAALAFAIAGGCTPEADFTKASLAHVPATTIATAERALRTAGVAVAAVPLFEQARAKRSALVTRLERDLATYQKTHVIDGMQIIYASTDPEVAAFFAGDVEVAELAAGYLEPDRDGRYPAVAVFLIEQLGASSPAVLAALDKVAAGDVVPETRAQAAAAATKLRAIAP